MDFHKAWHWFQVISPFLIVSLIPSIINGLKPYPKAAGAIHWLEMALDFISVLSRSDSPGTLKVPLTKSELPLGVFEPVKQ